MISIDPETQFIHPKRPKFYDNQVTTEISKKSFEYYKKLIIKYYPHSIPEEWTVCIDNVINNPPIEFIDYNKAVLKLQSKLNDSHCYTNKNLNYYFTGGFICNFDKEYNVIVEETSNPDVPKGAIILKKNNTCVQTILQKMRKYSRGSNDTIKDFYTLNTFISRCSNRNVSLTLKINEKVLTINVTYEYYFPKFNEPFYKIKNNKIVINPAGTSSKDMIEKEIPEKIKGIDTCIINLTQYPKDFENFLYFITQLNFSNKRIHFCNYYHALKNGKHSKIKLYIEKGKIKNYSKIKKIIITVDHCTLSASEHFVLALQALPLNVITKGRQTSGANGDITSIPMLFDTFCNINFNYVTYPNNEPLQRTGVKIT